MVCMQLAVVVACLVAFTDAFLSVRGNNFYFNGKKTFLMGSNIAWKNYARDFGNNHWASVKGSYDYWLRSIGQNGGNSARIWLHIDGQSTPKFNSNGYVTGTDNNGRLIADLKELLDMAAKYNVFIILTLWNGAIKPPTRFNNLFWSDVKLNSYINNALVPMVRALKNKKALGAWEIINEPEGSVKIAGGNGCADTNRLGPQGAGWEKGYIDMGRIQRFVSWQADAIHKTDPKALVTVGSWKQSAQSNAYGDSYNYYTDACLLVAGGKPKGYLDFYQVHTYTWKGKYSYNSPMKVPAANFKVRKPLVIGEFSARESESRNLQALFQHAYSQGYAGAWTWQANQSDSASDPFNNVLSAFRAMSRKSGIKVTVG